MNERLKELRKELDLSQRDFCKNLGIPQPTYAALETGKRDFKDSYIYLICKTYNVNEEWLRYGVGNMFISKPDKNIEELIEIYDSLTPVLQQFLLKQGRELKVIQETEISKEP